MRDLQIENKTPLHTYCVQSLSRVRLYATPWTIAHQSTLSMEFSRQEYWNGLPFPSPGDLPNTRIKPASLAAKQKLSLIASGNAEHPLWKTVWKFLTESNILLPYDVVSMLISIYSHELKIFVQILYKDGGFPGGSDSKESAYNVGDPGLIPGWGRSFYHRIQHLVFSQRSWKIWPLKNVNTDAYSSCIHYRQSLKATKMNGQIICDTNN